MTNEIKWTTLTTSSTYNNSAFSDYFSYNARRAAKIPDEEILFEDEAAEMPEASTPQKGNQIPLDIGNCKCSGEILCDECVWDSYV